MTIIAVTLVAAALIPGRQAVAMEFRNCLGSDIRISFHDDEAGDPIPTGAAVKPLGAGETRDFGLHGNFYLVKIFRVQGDKEKFVLLRSGVPGNGNRYLVHLSGAHYSIKAGDECSDPQPLAIRSRDEAQGPVHGRTPFASIMLDSGIWVSGSTTWFRITGFDGRSFRLSLSTGSREALGLAEQTAENAWSTYTLAGRDAYRDEAGNVFVMRDRYSALWNGIPHRYSWLE
jgi:hypothetical protein